MSAKQIILNNVAQWRKTHPVHIVTPEEQAHKSEVVRRCDRYHCRNGRIVSIAQALDRASSGARIAA